MNGRSSTRLRAWIRVTHYRKALPPRHDACRHQTGPALAFGQWQVGGGAAGKGQHLVQTLEVDGCGLE